jgi:hypothetical protein
MTAVTGLVSAGETSGCHAVGTRLAALLPTVGLMADNAAAASPQQPPGRASRDARAGSPAATPSWRSFAVEAHAGRKIAGWSLGHFDIGADRLRVRLGFPWFLTRSADKDTITNVSVARIVHSVPATHPLDQALTSGPTAAAPPSIAG